MTARFLAAAAAAAGACCPTRRPRASQPCSRCLTASAAAARASSSVRKIRGASGGGDDAIAESRPTAMLCDEDETDPLTSPLTSPTLHSLLYLLILIPILNRLFSSRSSHRLRLAFIDSRLSLVSPHSLPFIAPLPLVFTMPATTERARGPSPPSQPFLTLPHSLQPAAPISLARKVWSI